ncbi:MAG: glutamate-1-semialdehyde 2,1-aminomutase [Planctomycetes bacterium]|jgi:glutamate-1-semialdehyde 2,1-aminomutase|nr:glutamate-1-semialdehyde 2,1-aminomutase [Planctomycetota bacterium]
MKIGRSSTSKSTDAMRRAKSVLVGGVNSPVRAFCAVGGEPPFIASGRGAIVTDVDGNNYIDYVGSYGPAILGHAHPDVVAAIADAAGNGAGFGAPTELEIHLAQAIVSFMPSIEKVRFVSSGTEAVMTAIRLARGVTGRAGVIKCIGCYHGHSDAMLVSAGSGATTLGHPSSPGVPPGAAADTMLVPYNDVEAIRRVLTTHDKHVAAVLVEGVAGNMGVVPPHEGYLPSLRALCDEFHVLLILDEVMTGFRLAPGGAQQIYGVRPDITTLGKIIGGGLPVGAVGASARIMDHLSPVGSVYQAGTLSGNPVTMAAGLATLRELGRDGFYDRLEAKCAVLEARLREQISKCQLSDALCLNRVGSMMTLFFRRGPITNYADATGGNTAAFAAFFNSMLDSGVYLPPSQYEAMFISAAHDERHIEHTASAAKTALQAAAKVM